MKLNNTASHVLVGIVTALTTVLIAMFWFTNQRSTEAYQISVSNRERIAVLESKFDTILDHLNEIKRAIK